jgi:hypothetical protein
MEETRPKTFVFVLMPFDSKFDDIYQYGIREACREAGAYCERVDEQIFDESILEQIYNQIAKADVIVADMTGQNPNVFYETGYAHALNKRVILLTWNRESIPFDLKHYTHIIYEGKISYLRTELKRRISWCVENPKESLSSVDINLDFSINGIAIGNKPVVEINRVKYCYLNLDIHNPMGTTLDSKTYSLALILPSKADFKEPNILSAAKISEEQYLYTLENTHNIFPFGWFSMKVVFELFKVEEREKEVILRLFQEIGYKDFTFILKPEWVR